jgi:hypothetical protein
MSASREEVVRFCMSGRFLLVKTVYLEHPSGRSSSQEGRQIELAKHFPVAARICTLAAPVRQARYRSGLKSLSWFQRHCPGQGRNPGTTAILVESPFLSPALGPQAERTHEVRLWNTLVRGRFSGNACLRNRGRHRGHLRSSRSSGTPGAGLLGSKRLAALEPADCQRVAGKRVFFWKTNGN